MRNLFKSLTALIVLIVCITPAAQALTVFDADFDAEPLGPLGLQPNTDPLPLALPTSIINDSPGAGDFVQVVAAAGDLTDKPVMIDSTPGNLVSAAFYNPRQFTSGIAHISWDGLLMGDSPATTGNSGARFVVAQNDGGSFEGIFRLTYAEGNVFEIYDGSGTLDAGSYVAGTADRFDIYLNLDDSTYILDINGTQISAGALDGTVGFNHFFANNLQRFSLAGDEDIPALVFDNLVITAIPEPPTAALIPVALTLFLLRRRRAA